MDERSVFQKIGDAVVDFAPGIAGLLAVTGVGAPAAAAIGAVAALGRSFGLGSSAKPEEVLQAISADPEIRLKALVAENDFKAEMGRQELDKLKAELADTQSARTREIEGVKATGKPDKFLHFLAFWCIFAPVALIVAMLYYGLPKMTPEVALLVGGFIGIIIGEYKTVTGYYFGTSKSSADKSAIMGQMRNQMNGR